jgi:outer membrane protein TolC
MWAQSARRHRAAPSSGALTQIFLRGQAARQRGDAIAEALKGHYALLMLEEQIELLDASLQTATSLQTQIARAITLGLATPADESLWQVQSTISELKDRRIQAEGRSLEIRQQMAARMQAPWLCDYLPADSLDATLPPGDCSNWCRDALAQRADYRSWQWILSRMNESSVQEVQGLINQLIPAWTAAIPLHPIWLKHLSLGLGSQSEGDVRQLRSQMARALQGFGNHICAEVQTAAIQAETALKRAALAQEQLLPVEEQLERASQLAEIGQGDEAEQARWVLRRQQAQLNILARRGEAKQAELEMRRLMGFWDR